MGKVTWARKDEIGDAYSTIPAISAGSRKDFRPPPTIESDFKRYLSHSVPNVNFTFELVHNWYAAQVTGYTPIYIRAAQTPIEWKSKIGNSDMSMNFKTTHEIPIYKGDILVREDGAIFMLNWNVQNHPNNQSSQSIECNYVLSIVRNMPETTDANGMLLTEAYQSTIVDKLPCLHEEYAGRPDYAAAQGSPGIAADHLITVSMQWNPSTKNVRINDQFVIGDSTYRVVNISLAEVHIDQLYGILKINARRVAGGGVDAE